MKLEIMIDGIDEVFANEIERAIKEAVNISDYGGNPVPDVSIEIGHDDADHAVETCSCCGVKYYAYQLTGGLCDDCLYDKEHNKEG